MMKLKSIFLPKNILGSILLLLAGIFFYTHVLEHDWRYKTLTDEEIKKYRISENTALSLYQIMKDTHELLTKHNINYWIDGGTLLGAVRHQGIIPYDDDLDIGIIQEDEIRLQQIFPEFQKLGYSISHDLAYKICQKGCIDIFTFQKEQNKFIHANLKTRTQYPNDFFYDHELLPLKKYKFGNIEVFGPYNPKENLNRQYPEWDKYAVIHHPHNFHLFFLSNIEKKTKFILTPELLKPAKALKPLKNRVD
ncbi:LicD family protein [Rickettsia endosymbiont of Pantilius tunicatus]|uniref:LicD family protein n=1 Tax=Rickettsia endosymbiont of Pantilius tunicatus TaxID=3066267 RepID=UPI0030DFB7E5